MTHQEGQTSERTEYRLTWKWKTGNGEDVLLTLNRDFARAVKRALVEEAAVDETPVLERHTIVESAWENDDAA